MGPPTGSHEYILQGSIIDSAVDTLLQRIKGLADPKSETFNEQEMVFLLKTQNATIAQLHCRFDASPNSDSIYQLKYIGLPEPDVSQVSGGPKTAFPVLCRRIIETMAKSKDMMQFFRAIGFRYEYGFVAEGTLFTKGHLKLTVSKVSRLETPGHITTAQKLTNSYLVELSAVAPPGDIALAKTMRDFADQLKPLVRLEKQDCGQLFNQHAMIGLSDVTVGK